MQSLINNLKKSNWNNYKTGLLVILIVMAGFLFVSHRVFADPIPTEDPNPGEIIEENNSTPSAEGSFMINCKSAGIWAVGIKHCFGSVYVGLGQVWKMEATVEAYDPNGGDGNRPANVYACINNTGMIWQGDDACWALNHASTDPEKKIDNNDFRTFKYLTGEVVVKGSTTNPHWHQHRFWGYGRTSTLNELSTNKTSLQVGETAHITSGGAYNNLGQTWVTYPDGFEQQIGDFPGNTGDGYDGTNAFVDFTALGNHGTGTATVEFSAFGPQTNGVASRGPYRTIDLMITPAPPSATTYNLAVNKTGLGVGTVTSSPAGIDCGSDCNEAYNDGIAVVLTATPSSGYIFDRWSGDCSGFSNTCTVSMTQARDVTAKFDTAQAVTYTITASSGANGSVAPAGVTTKNSGTSQTYTIDPSANYHIAGVLVDSASVGTVGTYTFSNISANHTISATFTANPPNTHTLTINKAGSGSGTVTGTGINCGSDCSETYASGTVVTLTASAGSDSTFAGWSEDLSGTVNPQTITMNGDKSVTATFNLTSTSLPQPTCSSAGPDGDTISGVSGSRHTYVLGVTNAAAFSTVPAVMFPTWSEYNGQDDITWYPASNEGGGTWSYNIPKNQHPELGNIYVHVYLYNASYPSGVYCDSANYVRVDVGTPTAWITANGISNATTITNNTSANVSWGSANVSTCWVTKNGVAIGWGPETHNENIPTGLLASPPSSYVYTVSCDNGAASASVAVNIQDVPGVITFSVTYIVIANTGTLNVSCSPSPAGAGWTIQGIGHRSGPSSSDQAAPNSYAISFDSVGGYNTPASQTATVTTGNTTNVSCSYTTAPLSPPTTPNVDNSTCGHLVLSWTDTNSGRQNGFNILRSTTNSNFAQIGSVGGSTTSFTDTMAPAEQSYYYKVQAFINSPAESVDSGVNGPTRNNGCTANFDNSSKALVAVNGSAYTSSTLIKTGDTLTFQITLNNAGPVSATVNYLDDALSSNLSNPTNLKVDKNGNGVYNESGESGTITGTVPNIRLNVSGTKPAGNPNWVIKFDATISTNSTAQYDSLSNSATINYTDSSTKTKTVSTGQILFQTGQGKAPNFREVAP